MDQAIKAKWIEALRSGKYSQAPNVLRGPQGHCCLGVLCDVVDPSRWKSDDDGWKWGGQRRYLPSSIEEANPDVRSLCGKLMEMNDDGRPFSEIASFIEQKL